MYKDTEHPHFPSLSLYLRDLGYGATYSSNVVFAVLEQLSIHPSNAATRITEPQVGKTLAMMASTSSGLVDNPALTSLTFSILNHVDAELLAAMKTWNVELFFVLCRKLVS